MREQNSTSTMTEYHFTVKIEGEPPTEITYSISDLEQPDVLRPVAGSMNFTHDINMDWLLDNFFDMFEVSYLDLEINFFET